MTAPNNHFLNKEESFMYDREHRFPLEETMNAARIEYTEKAVMHMAARRCDLIAVSISGAVLALNTDFSVPLQFYLDVPDARINRIGCVLMRVNANMTVQARFLKLLPQRELDRIFVYSTHPKHKNRLLDLRG